MNIEYPQSLIPMVIETTNRGERAYDIYSLLLRNRIVFLGSSPETGGNPAITDYLANVTIQKLLFLQYENRNQEMSFISRSLKELAKELHVPVVGISQLSRAPEKARGTAGRSRPQLSDLRESGAIEQDADVVIFLHTEDLKAEARDVAVAKQRNGPVGDLQLAFLSRYTKFEPLERNP